MSSSKFVTLCLVLPLLSCVKPKDSPKVSGKDKAEAENQTPETGKNPDSKTPTGTDGATEPEGTVVTYPEADPDLGEEIQPSEVDAANKVAKVIEDQINTKYPTGSGKRALRDAHPKMHGCLRATFEVDPDIKTEYAQGVFAKGNKFDAVIRFSNSSHIPTQADIKKDGRGMAFKLFDVPGKKLLDVESQAKTQDFVMISHPVFFTKDPVKYIDFISNFETIDSDSTLESAKALAKTTLALGITGMKIANDIKSLQVSSPIQTTYHSNVPYQLGVGAAKKAVKYKAVPCAINGKDSIPTDTKDDNYLRTRLIEHFKNADACMDIYVQERAAGESVEDSMIQWKGDFSKVATLRMKKEDQKIAATPDLNDPLNKACDTLSFNPWHSLPEHKPLGSMNRVRKIVYEHISKLRHTINSEPRKEPTDNKLQ